MTLYILEVAYDYEEAILIGIFSSKEKAEELRARIKYSRNESRIREVILDTVVPANAWYLCDEGEDPNE